VELTGKLDLRARADGDASHRVAGGIQRSREARRGGLARVRSPRRSARPDHHWKWTRPGWNVQVESVPVGAGRLGRCVVEIGVCRRRTGRPAAASSLSPARLACRGRCLTGRRHRHQDGQDCNDGV
jgi:hypothetical protein